MVKTEIDITKEYECNDEIYEGLILEFCIEEKLCAVCGNLGKTTDKEICRNCIHSSNFILAEYKEVNSDEM